MDVMILEFFMQYILFPKVDSITTIRTYMQICAHTHIITVYELNGDLAVTILCPL